MSDLKDVTNKMAAVNVGSVKAEAQDGAGSHAVRAARPPLVHRLG